MTSSTKKRLVKPNVETVRIARSAEAVRKRHIDLAVNQILVELAVSVLPTVRKDRASFVADHFSRAV